MALVVADEIAVRFARDRGAGAAGAGPEARFDGHGYCWVELGGGQAAFAVGDFYAQPDPSVALRSPGRAWHLGKVIFERYWLGGEAERALAALGLRLGASLFGLPARL